MEIDILRPQPVPEDAIEVRVPMRDGVELAADLYTDNLDRRPVVLVRLPYDKTGAYCAMPEVARYFRNAGYAALIQDVRGKFRSDGATEFGVHEIDDGYDTLEWIAAQPWSDGRVVMCGDSYFGMTQLAAAASGHPALAAISPRLTGTQLGGEVRFQDGSRDVEATARKEYFASWFVDQNAYEWEADWNTRPLRNAFETFFDEIGRRSANFDAEFSSTVAPFRGPEVERLLSARPIPTMFTVGLFDNCAPYTWHDVRQLLTRSDWRDLVHLRIEAVDHENVHVTDTAPASEQEAVDVARLLDPTLEFFDAVLHGSREDVPPVHCEIVGGGTLTSVSWPPEGSREEAMYLGRVEQGLVLAKSPGPAAAAAWTHDPNDPVPSEADNPFSRLASRRDLAEIASRQDVLTFAGAPARGATDYVGPVRVHARLTSTVSTTNLHARLLDVAPDGTHLIVAKGQVHIPDVASEDLVTVDLHSIAYRMPVGHLWALQLMSSDYPEYVLEPGDGSDFWEAEVLSGSEQTLHLGADAGTRIEMTLL